MKIIKKILKDTLLDEKGKVSRKSITALFSLIIGTFYGVFLPIYLKLIHEIDWVPLDYVFYTYMGLSGGSITLSLIEKIKKNEII